MTTSPHVGRWRTGLLVSGAAMAVAWYLAITSFTGMVDDLTTGPIPDAKLTLQAGDQAVFLEGDLANGVHKCRCPRAKASSVVITDLNGKVVPTTPIATFSGRTHWTESRSPR